MSTKTVRNIAGLVSSAFGRAIRWGLVTTNEVTNSEPPVSGTVSSLFRRLGLPKGASLHVLRHTHASVLLANGVDLATVSERLGHSSVRVTAEVYSHAIRGRDREAANIWDQIKKRDAATRQTARGVN